MNDIIIALIKDITFKNVTLDQPLVSSGLLDSVAMVDLVLALEAEFDLSIDIEDLTPEKLENVEQIAELVREKQAG
ncbi:acyl carrier protein [Endozoicomonadaceae bacterium StTr2]